MDTTSVSFSKPSDQLTVLVQPTPVMPDRRTISQFSGFMHEDSENFLSEFESYLTLAAIEITFPRAVAACHLFLNGPALIWLNSLSVKDSWSTVKAAFIQEYCNILSSPSLIAESVAFDNLRLSQSQAIEGEADMFNRFISGLPSQLAFFVRADRVESLRDALQSANIGEAQGYRVQASAVTFSSIPNLVPLLLGLFRPS